MKKTLKGIALSALLVVSAHALASERMMIIMDGSGSMWGQIDGQPKLKIAQQALRELVESAPDALELGLMAYGHRQKGDCNDIEVLVAVGPDNKNQIIQASEAMRFLGKTPLTAAVKQAAQELRHTEDKATVVLITDGEETCQADPCALGTELSQTGVDFTAHVVGFDLTQQQGEQVACLAHNTGGQYFAADDMAELQTAMRDTLAAVQAEPQPKQTAAAPITPEPAHQTEPAPQPEPEEAVTSAASVDGPEATGSASTIEVSWTGPDEQNDYITVVTKDAKDEEYINYARVRNKNPVSIQVPDAVGDYEIRYVDQASKTVLGRQSIVLTPVQATLSSPETALAGSNIEVDWTGPQTPNDYITIAEAGAPDAEYDNYVRVRDKTPVTLMAPDQLGNYEIRYVISASKRVLASVPITLEPVSATVEIQNTPVPGGNVTVAWTGPANPHDYIAIAPRATPAKYVTYARVRDEPVVTLKVPDDEGDYLVTYVISSSKRILASTPLALAEASGSVSAAASAEAGSVISVTWQGPSNRNDFIEIVPAEAAADVPALVATRTSQGSPLSVHAPAIPGTYQIRYMMRDTGEVLASTSIEIE